MTHTFCPPFAVRFLKNLIMSSRKFRTVSRYKISKLSARLIDKHIFAFLGVKTCE